MEQYIISMLDKGFEIITKKQGEFIAIKEDPANVLPLY